MADALTVVETAKLENYEVMIEGARSVLQANGVALRRN